MENLILILAGVAPVLLVLACLAVWRLWRKTDKRRSPLTFDIRNLPGEHLRRQVAKHDDGFMESASLVAAIGPIFLSAWLLARLQSADIDWSRLQLGWGDAAIAAAALAMLAWTVLSLIRHARARRYYLEGLQAELAVAQCLTPLIAEGGIDLPPFLGPVVT